MSEDREQPVQNVVVISGTTIIIAAVTIPIVFVWLTLAGIIIFSATRDPDVLANIEGLLTALAVLSIPTSLILADLMRHWHAEMEAKKNGQNGQGEHTH